MPVLAPTFISFVLPVAQYSYQSSLLSLQGVWVLFRCRGRVFLSILFGFPPRAAPPRGRYARFARARGECGLILDLPLQGFSWLGAILTRASEFAVRFLREVIFAGAWGGSRRFCLARCLTIVEVFAPGAFSWRAGRFRGNYLRRLLRDMCALRFYV